MFFKADRRDQVSRYYYFRLMLQSPWFFDDVVDENLGAPIFHRPLS